MDAHSARARRVLDLDRHADVPAPEVQRRVERALSARIAGGAGPSTQLLGKSTTPLAAKALVPLGLAATVAGAARSAEAVVAVWSRSAGADAQALSSTRSPQVEMRIAVSCNAAGSGTVAATGSRAGRTSLIDRILHCRGVSLNLVKLRRGIAALDRHP